MQSLGTYPAPDAYAPFIYESDLGIPELELA